MRAEPPLFAVVLSVAAICVGVPAGAVPLQFAVQGRLTDAQNVNRDGQAIDITVRLWSAAAGGNLLYVELERSVPIVRGNFQVLVGGDPALGSPKQSLDTVLDGSVVYVEFQVANEPAMVPRQPLLSAPNAIRSGTAEVATSLSPSATAKGDLSVQGIINAAGFLLNGSQLDSGLYVAYYTSPGGGSYSINLNTGQVSGGALVFMGGKKFPVGSTAIAMPVIQAYSVGFCQVGNGEYVLVNEKRTATISDVTNVTFLDTYYNCAGTGANGAIFVGR